MGAVETLLLVVGYDGREFAGAAPQPGMRTVVGALRSALELVLQRPTSLAIAGRTDAGVHARAQLVSVPLEPGEQARLGDVERLCGRLGRLAGRGLWVRSAGVLAGSVDARRLARWRHYLYRLDLGRGDRRGRVMLEPTAWACGPLDRDVLAGALATLRGDLDATGLCRAGAAGGYRRRVLSTRVWVRARDRVDVSVIGVSFCHEFVRRAVGNAVALAQGRLDGDRWREGVGRGERALLTAVAPSWGLSLWRVGLEDGWEWSEERLARLGSDADWRALDPREVPAVWGAARGADR